jgi:hypothetical protein
MPSIRLPILALAALPLAAACSDPTDELPVPGDAVPPVVTALDPPPGAQDVDVAAVITVRFSEPINPATVGPASFAVRKGFDAVAGTYAFGDGTASFVPDANLAYLGSFGVTLTRGIRDPAGNQLARDTSWAFQVRGQGTPSPARR